MLIGSRALAHWIDFPIKPDTDYDLILPSGCKMDKDFQGKVDFHRPEDCLNDAISYMYGSGEFVNVGGWEVEVCSLRGLALIKRSHLWRDYFWEKHIAQYNNHLREHFDERDRSIMNERAKLLRESIRYSQPSLLKTNEEFFDDAVDKKYDHDWLHELVAFGKHPIYLDMKKDFSLAWCEKGMWDKFPLEKKLMCVAEEGYVIALERFLIPNDWEYSFVGAYLKALQKICTTLTSGWFRDFAIDNLPEIMLLFDKQKMQSIRSAINDKE